MRVQGERLLKAKLHSNYKEKLQAECEKQISAVILCGGEKLGVIIYTLVNICTS